MMMNCFLIVINPFQKQYVLIYVPRQLSISQVSQMMMNLKLQKHLLERSTIKTIGSQMYITDNENNMSVNESMSNIDPLLNGIKQSRLQNHKSLILTHINVNSLKKEENAPLDYFKHIMHQGYVDALFICESKLNDKITKNEVSVGSKCKVIDMTEHLIQVE